MILRSAPPRRGRSTAMRDDDAVLRISPPGLGTFLGASACVDSLTDSGHLSYVCCSAPRRCMRGLELRCMLAPCLEDRRREIYFGCIGISDCIPPNCICYRFRRFRDAKTSAEQLLTSCLAVPGFSASTISIPDDNAITCRNGPSHRPGLGVRHVPAWAFFRPRRVY